MWESSRRIAQQYFGVEILAELGEKLVQPLAGGFGRFYFEILGLLVAGEHGARVFLAGLGAELRRVAEPEQALVLTGKIGLLGGLQGLRHELARRAGARGFKIEPAG